MSYPKYSPTEFVAYNYPNLPVIIKPADVIY